MHLENFTVCGKKKLIFTKKKISTVLMINKVIHIFSLSGEKFMPELNLKQP